MTDYIMYLVTNIFESGIIMKSFILTNFFVLFLSFEVLAASQARKSCTFTRHQHVEIEGSDFPKPLKNKILNNFNPDKLYLQKENKEMGIKICGSLRSFHDLKDISEGKAQEEHFLTKVNLVPDKQDHWVMTTESFMRKGEKETVPVTAPMSFISPQKIKLIKDAEVVDWVTANLLNLSAK